MKNKQIIKHHVKKIIVRSTNWVGDSVITTPVFRALDKIFPWADIDVIARPWNEAVFQHNPFIHKIHVFNEKQSYGQYLKSIRCLRKEKYDLGILLPNSFNAAFQAFLGGVKQRVGFQTDGRRFLLTHPLPVPEDKARTHQVYYYLQMLGFLEHFHRDNVALEIFITDEEKEWAKNYLSELGIHESELIVGINPGAEYGPAKRWFPEYFAKVADKLAAKHNGRVLVFGSPKEKEFAANVCKHMTMANHNLAGKTTLRQLMALVSMVNLFVTNDTGTMHIAAALHTPTVAIFGSTCSIATGPFSKESTVVRPPSHLNCMPCLKKTCRFNHYKCLKTITPEIVLNAAEPLIDKYYKTK